MKKKKIISLIVMIVGLITLVIGVCFLVINLNQAPAVQDGEYLVEGGEWIRENTCDADAGLNCPAVRWRFTEIGKGTLTTDGGENNYDFIWAIKDGKLLIETDWLYALNNEYEYELDQGKGLLTLVDGENEYTFFAISKTEKQTEEATE